MVLGVPVSDLDYPAPRNLPLTVQDRFDQDAWLWLNAWFIPVSIWDVWIPFWINSFGDTFG